MTLDATALTALQQIVQQAMPYLVIDLPSDAGGTTRLSSVDLSLFLSPAAGDIGFYDGKIKDWGSITYKVSDREGNLQAVETQVTVDDTGTQAQPVGSIGRALKLADCQGSTCHIGLAIQGIPYTSYPVLFTGILDRWEREGETSWRLYFRINDEFLQKPGNRVKIGQADWPGAHKDALGKYAPIAFGTVSSAGLGASGYRTALLVDVDRRRYLHSLGSVGSTGFSVYSNGVLTSTPTDYTRTVAIVGGRTYTYVDFVADQGDAVITIDSQGIDLGSYGTKTNPANQLRFFLENCVFRDWNGVTIASPTYTDTTSFTALASFLTGYEGAPSIGGGDPVDGMTLLRGFCQSYSAVCYWTEAGQVAVSPFTPFTSSIYPTDPIVFYGEDMTGKLGLMTSSDELIRALTLRYLTGPTNEPTQAITVVLPSKLSAAAKDRVSIWGPGRVV